MPQARQAVQRRATAQSIIATNNHLIPRCVVKAKGRKIMLQQKTMQWLYTLYVEIEKYRRLPTTFMQLRRYKRGKLGQRQHASMKLRCKPVEPCKAFAAAARRFVRRGGVAQIGETALLPCCPHFALCVVLTDYRRIMSKLQFSKMQIITQTLKDFPLKCLK